MGALQVVPSLFTIRPGPLAVVGGPLMDMGAGGA